MTGKKSASTKQPEHQQKSPVFSDQSGRVCIRIKVTCPAKETVIKGIDVDEIAIQIAAPAVEGKANQELLRYLKSELGLSAEISRGHTNRSKLLVVEAGKLSEDDVRERFQKAMGVDIGKN